MLVLAGGSALRESAAIDEVAHIGAGVSYLQRLDLRLNGEHPPLPKVIATLPLVLRGVRADYSTAPWERASDRHMSQWVFGEWLLDRWNDQQTILLWTRLPMLALSLAFGWTVFVIGRRLGGDWGGVLALTAYATNPTFLAFGPLVVTDVAVALFSLLALWTFANLYEHPYNNENGVPVAGAVNKRVVLFGAALACAILSKFTAGILLFAFAAVALSLRAKPVAKLQIPRRALAKGILCAAAIVYLVYLVLSWNQPTTELDYVGTGPVALFARRLLMPVWLCVRGVFALLSNASRPTFLLGQTYPHGVWFYFPVLFALKSTPGFLGLLLLAGGLVLLGRRVPDNAIHWRVLCAGFAVFTAFGLLSRVNIGLRHFTVPMILLIVGVSALPRLIGSSRLAGSLTILCAASCIVSAILAYPYYIPYVNVFGFGQPAYKLMGDSNIDWHQALPEVQAFAENHHLAQIRLDDYGLSDPVAAVPQAIAWNCAHPGAEDAGQWAVVSANMFLDFRHCTWLTSGALEPLGGGSMYAVRLPAPIPPSAYSAAAPATYAPRALYREAVRNPERTSEMLDKLEAGANPSTSRRMR